MILIDNIDKLFNAISGVKCVNLDEVFQSL